MWTTTTLRTALKILFVPGGLLFFGAVIVAYSGWLTLTQPALSFLCYSVLIGGMLLAWRFHSSRIFLALIVLFLAREAEAFFAAGYPAIPRYEWSALQALSVFVPLNFVLIALMPERGFITASTAPIGLLLFVESIVVAVFGQISERTKTLYSVLRHSAANIAHPHFWVVPFAVAGIVLLSRSILRRKPGDSALLWSLAAFFLSLRFAASPRVVTIYSATSACILVAAIIENSYLLAYHDELTGLPSRRAFNDALLRLHDPYSIAIVDIDRFKRFNDTHGHDIGDQVLRLVAANLSRVTGGGQAYRCGGEEFAILFPGKTTPEVVPHLEQLRAAIESSEFRMRGSDRRQIRRGPDRRNGPTRRRTGKGQVIRRLAQQENTTVLSVTVSVGVATSSKDRALPDQVQQAADKALYRAKDNGRNRIETASSPRRRAKPTAVGIA